MIYTCFDIESTGLNSHKDDPIQFAYMRFDEAFRVLKASCVYIKPTRGIWSEEAEEVHHIDRFFLAANGVEPDVAAASIWAACCRSNLVGYNSKGFDWNLLTNWFQALNLPQCLISSHTDVMVEWQRRLGGKRQKLTNLTANLKMPPEYVAAMTKRYFDVPDHLYRPHDACYDTMATFLCFQRLVMARRAEAQKALEQSGGMIGGAPIDV